MPTLNPNLRSFWQNSDGKLIRARNRVLYGGRASSKSWEFAGRAAQIAQAYKTRFLCVRRFQNKIKESVYTLVKNQIDNFGFTGYEVLSNEIRHNNGSDFVFYGIERNIDEIKSFEGADVLWIEEAHNLTKEQWAILEPTIRKQGSEVWISFNPRFINDFIWQHFIVNTPENTIVRCVNYTENPFISDTLLNRINEMKETDFDEYEHVYLGKPKNDNDQVIIKRSWVEAAIDFHEFANGNDSLFMGGASVVGYDVADSGEDLNATVTVCGSIVEDCQEWKGGENELRKSAKRVKLTASRVKAKIIYDSIGVGAGTGSTLNDLSFYNHASFNAAGKVIKPKLKYEGIKQGEFFSNLKAQAWWLVADRLRNTYDYRVNGNKKYKSDDLISISSDIKDIEKLITELTTPYKDFDKNGRVKVESKDDLKKRGVNSPNKADAFIMALSQHLVKSVKISDLQVSGF